jgi:hypothetical protein
MLSVKGGVVLANGIFVSTICSDKEAKVIKTTLEEWEKYQNKFPNPKKYKNKFTKNKLKIIN